MLLPGQGFFHRGRVIAQVFVLVLAAPFIQLPLQFYEAVNPRHRDQDIAAYIAYQALHQPLFITATGIAKSARKA